MENLLNSTQLAEKLQVQVSSIRAWTRSGKIPHYRVGASVRYSLADVLKALEHKQ